VQYHDKTLTVIPDPVSDCHKQHHDDKPLAAILRL
jgi:hypothetical protein